MGYDSTTDDSGGIIQQFLSWGIFPHPDKVEAVVKKVKTDNPYANSKKLIEELAYQAKMISAGQGVVAALPGAIPGIGTISQIAVSGATILPDTIAMQKDGTSSNMYCPYQWT